MSQIDSTVLNQFIQLLAGAFSKVSTDRFAPVVTPAELPTAAGYHWRLVQFDEIPPLQIFVGAIKRSDDGAEAADAEMTRRLGMVFSILAEDFGAESGRKAVASIQEVEVGPDTNSISLRVQSSGGLEELILCLDAAAVSWLSAHTLKKEPKSTRMTMMDTLMDVELPVSILLARREASLSDVLQWGPGAIVEFEAGLGDPVEVIVNDQTVARGSVVLVDGNYGIRVTEVLTGNAVGGPL